MTIAEIIAVVVGSIGLLFVLASFFGLVTFPDFVVRLHAQGVGDTLGLFFILISMAICVGLRFITIKYVLILIITMVTNPLGTTILLQAVSHKGDFQRTSGKEEPIINNEEAPSELTNN